MAEVSLGLMYIFQQVLPQTRDLMMCLMIWQFLRLRYMLSADVKEAFSNMHNSILPYSNKIPFLGSIYVKATSMMHSYAMPTPRGGGGSGAAAPSCVIM